jgi:GDP-mannose 6-dehydrogenase
MTAAVLSLSCFNMSSDDRRESPNMRLAKTPFATGYSIRIKNPVVRPSQLVGTNRRYVESGLPHLQHLLGDNPAEALEGADTAGESSSDESVIVDFIAARPKRIQDLTGGLVATVESLLGYEGVGW